MLLLATFLCVHNHKLLEMIICLSEGSVCDLCPPKHTCTHAKINSCGDGRANVYFWWLETPTEHRNRASCNSNYCHYRSSRIALHLYSPSFIRDSIRIDNERIRMTFPMRILDAYYGLWPIMLEDWHTRKECGEWFAEKYECIDKLECAGAGANLFCENLVWYERNICVFAGRLRLSRSGWKSVLSNKRISKGACLARMLERLYTRSSTHTCAPIKPLEQSQIYMTLACWRHTSECVFYGHIVLHIGRQTLFGTERARVYRPIFSFVGMVGVRSHDNLTLWSTLYFPRSVMM